MLAIGVALLIFLGAVGLVGMLVSMIAIARLGQQLPGQPIHTRLNPLNHMARRDTWTPEMHAANRRGVISGLVFLGAALAIVVLVIGLGAH